VPVPALSGQSSNFTASHRQKPRRKETVFVELMPLLKERTLLITVARVDDRVKVNGEDNATDLEA
jgi:hypothetical protein